MIKHSTLTNFSLSITGEKETKKALLCVPSVDTLIRYSKALQVIRCNNFKTCYLVLN